MDNYHRIHVAKYIQSIISDIKARFACAPLVEAFQVFDPKVMQEHLRAGKDAESYGVADLQCILKSCGDDARATIDDKVKGGCEIPSERENPAMVDAEACGIQRMSLQHEDQIQDPDHDWPKTKKFRDAEVKVKSTSRKQPNGRS